MSYVPKTILLGIVVMVLFSIFSHLYWRIDDRTKFRVPNNKVHETNSTILSHTAVLNKTTSNDDRELVLTALADFVQRRLHALQNPRECSLARKYICRIHATCGLGCTIHHIAPCLFNAVGMNRTLVVELVRFEYGTKDGMSLVYKPLSETCRNVDDRDSGVDVKDKSATLSQTVIHHVHGNYKPFTPWTPFTIPDVLLQALWGAHDAPDLWWMGQLLAYITTLNSEAQLTLKKLKEKLGFIHPIVGVHVRRTDKLIKEAKKFELSEYMKHVEMWYEDYHNGTKHTNVTRRVYLSTDDPSVYQEALQKYPRYQFLVAVDHVANAGKHRKSTDGLQGIAFDIELLSSCDFLVCTFSSNVGRLAYELMFAKTNEKIKAASLDRKYFFGGFSRHLVAIRNNSKGSDDVIDLSFGDVIYQNLNLRTLQTVKIQGNEVKECPWPVRYEGFDWLNGSRGHPSSSAACCSWVSPFGMASHTKPEF